MITKKTRSSGRRRLSDKQREENFWKFVLITPFYECWVWIGFCSPDGYGRFRYYCEGKRRGLAHRFAFSLFNKLEQGMVIDHICRNRACVNPSHLRQVSQKINSLENSDGVSAINARKTHCIYGHELYGDNLYFYKGARFCKKCNARKALAWYHRKRSKLIGYKDCPTTKTEAF